MTELETIARARDVLQKLANGLNPLDNTPLPDDHFINNVQLARSLFCAVEILREVVRNGGVGAPPKKQRIKKVSFALTPEQIAAIPFSETPIVASELANRINSQIDIDVMQGITYKMIVGWLLEAKLLSYTENEGSGTNKRPTEYGEQIGISVENRFNRGRMYEVVVYNEEAQRFIVDHLDAIIEYTL